MPLPPSSEMLPDLPHLPSLKALQAFDAAARCDSLSRAADLLHVTHGAVSRQVRQLEEQMGVRLFERSGRGLVLTAAGRELATATRHHLEGLARVCRELSRGDAETPFVLSCPGSFLARWFIPRMARLKQALPQLELHLTASDDVSQLRPGVDAVLRFQQPPFGGDDGHTLQILGPERIGPVLRPGQWPQIDRDSGSWPPAQHVLFELPLLHTRSRPDAWLDWCTQQDMDASRLTQAQGFDHLSYLLEATLVGLGVGIAPDYLVEEDLRSGRLIAPWGFVATEAHLVLALPGNEASPRHPLSMALAEWLTKELSSQVTEEEHGARPDDGPGHYAS
uniref:LysR family transcriptional regulator n=1 Tax=Halomonas sp. TaxID=1486246 RepID=UPI002635459D|nr:LysR family transcriptional regulator [Halomonas sp.]